MGKIRTKKWEGERKMREQGRVGEEKVEKGEKLEVKVEEQWWIQGGCLNPPLKKNHHLHDGFPYELAIYWKTTDPLKQLKYSFVNLYPPPLPTGQ